MSSNPFKPALHAVLIVAILLIFLLRDACKYALARIRVSPKPRCPITLTDLPFELLDQIIRPTIDESKILAMDGLTATCRYLKDNRRISRKLTPYFSVLIYGEGHLFLHHESFGKILHFSPYIHTLVVWLPVFIYPKTSPVFRGFGSAAPSSGEKAYNKELREFWDVFHMDTSGERVWPETVEQQYVRGGSLGGRAMHSCISSPVRN